MPLVSLRAYARHRGITPGAVHKALASGRIRAAQRRDGCVLLDVEACDRSWRENTRVRADGFVGRGASSAAQPLNRAHLDAEAEALRQRARQQLSLFAPVPVPTLAPGFAADVIAALAEFATLLDSMLPADVERADASGLTVACLDVLGAVHLLRGATASQTEGERA